MSLRSEIIRVLNEFLANSKKISELDTVPSIDGAESLEVVKNGVNYRATVSQVATGGVTAFGEWNFATSGPSPGDFPTDQTKIYIVTDDSVYPSGTWIGYTATTGWTAK